MRPSRTYENAPFGSLNLQEQPQHYTDATIQQNLWCLVVWFFLLLSLSVLYQQSWFRWELYSQTPQAVLLSSVSVSSNYLERIALSCFPLQICSLKLNFLYISVCKHSEMFISFFNLEI